MRTKNEARKRRHQKCMFGVRMSCERQRVCVCEDWRPGERVLKWWVEDENVEECICERCKREAIPAMQKHRTSKTNVDMISLILTKWWMHMRRANQTCHETMQNGKTDDGGRGCDVVRSNGWREKCDRQRDSVCGVHMVNTTIHENQNEQKKAENDTDAKTLDSSLQQGTYENVWGYEDW